MSTRWKCRSAAGPAVVAHEPGDGKRAGTAGIRAWCAGRSIGPVLILTAWSGGCGQSQGELLYMLGVGRGQVVEAKFRLTDKPILVLLDDPTARIDLPAAKRHFVDELSQELIKNEAAKRIIPRRTVQNLRQATANFERRGCREVGEMAGAEQVLWVEVRDFVARERFYDPNNAASFVVTVKVINVRETRRSRVRLWPTSPNGYPLSVGLTGSEVTLAKTRDAIAKELVGRLVVKVAKLFYDYRLGDFEREQ